MADKRQRTALVSDRLLIQLVSELDTAHDLELAGALQRVLERLPKDTGHEITLDKITVREKMTLLLDKLRAEGKVLFESLFGDSKTRMEVLECGARANKIRVYEMVDDPVAREMVGYLLVRGGVHIVAYAKSLETLSGVEVGKLLPIPDISNKRFTEAMKHEAKGLHQVMYRMSPDDYRGISQLWKGPHPEDRSELRVVDGPPEGGPVPLHPDEPQLTAPIGPDGIDQGMLTEIAARLFGKTSTRS